MVILRMSVSSPSSGSSQLTLRTLTATSSFGDLDFSKSTALRSLTIHALRGIAVYTRYVRSCLQHTPVQELCISANMHIHEKTAWADMDETIVQSLAAIPRPNFVLCVALRPYATRHQSETFVKTALPECVRLGVVRCGNGDGDSGRGALFGRRSKSGTLSWDRCSRWVKPTWLLVYPPWI